MIIAGAGDSLHWQDVCMYIYIYTYSYRDRYTYMYIFKWIRDQLRAT